MRDVSFGANACGWPAIPHRLLARQTCKHRLVAAEPCSAAAQSRRHRFRLHARKGFGVALPRLPSFGGKNKAPAGGVAPSAPVDLRIPADVERLWAEAQQEWLQYSIEQPVLLPSLGAQVHLVPVGADLPGDAALIRDVVAAVQPDAIALESPPQHLKSYTSISKALEPQLARLLVADLPSPTTARTSLSQLQREELQASLLQACRGASLKPDPDQLTHLFLLGSAPFVEWLVPAHLVRTTAPQQPKQQPMLLTSCGLDRDARAAAPAASLFLGREFDVYLEEVEAALGEEVYGEVEAWRAALGDRLEAAGAGRELATLLAAWEAQCCVGPEQQRLVAARVAERMREEARQRRAAEGGRGAGVAEKWEGDVTLEVVRTAADALVAKRLVELAGGKDVVRRCQRIVAVVGRVHVLSVEEELKKIAAAQQLASAGAP